MNKNNLEYKDNIIEEHERDEKENKKLEDFNDHIIRKYDFEIITKEGKIRYLSIRPNKDNKYEVRVSNSPAGYPWVLMSDKWKIFENLNDAKEYFDKLSIEYGGIDKLYAEELRWDSRNICSKMNHILRGILGIWYS